MGRETQDARVPLIWQGRPTNQGRLCPPPLRVAEISGATGEGEGAGEPIIESTSRMSGEIESAEIGNLIDPH
eukprot:8080275-Pyramimonas_sp.AAC.1